MKNVTFGKNIRIIKTFMYYAKKKKWHNEDAFIDSLKDMRSGSQDVYIDDDELELIEKFETDNDKLKKVKDCFLIQLYTGIRYSDLSHLTPENIDSKNKRIYLYSLKTDTPIIIPIHKRLEKFLRSILKRL